MYVFQISCFCTYLGWIAVKFILIFCGWHGRDEIQVHLKALVSSFEIKVKKSTSNGAIKKQSKFQKLIKINVQINYTLQ